MKRLIDAGISFIGLVACTVIAGELLADLADEREPEHFPHLPRPLKAAAIIVFLTFAAFEANKVRHQFSVAWHGIDLQEEPT